MERIAEAGYVGACVDPNVSEIPIVRDSNPIRALGLKSAWLMPSPRRGLAAAAAGMAAEMNATQVNVIGGVMPLTAAEAMPTVETWLAMAEAYDFPLLLETHRNGTLNDLFFTLEVLEAVPELRLCADLSHFVVDRELQLPLSETD
jgi:sugar phosphate isomerase/epimerase